MYKLINKRDHDILSAVQRAAIRVAAADYLGVDPEPLKQLLTVAYELAELALEGAHEDALEDAYFGAYDTGDRAIPVLPREGKRLVKFRNIA